MKAKIDYGSSKDKDDPLLQQTFLEFVEKLVILDVLLEPYLAVNFIEYDSFPYDHNNFLGKETALLNIFTFWKHYQSKYAGKLEEAPILEEEYQAWAEKEGQSFSKEDDDQQEQMPRFK